VMPMSGFSKLFSSIVTSTIWCEEHQTLRVWIALLATCDSDGRVEGSLPGFASLARVTLDEMIHAVEILSSPDPHSRTPDNEGRRIESIPGGWLILNYATYREKGQAKEGSRAPYFRARRAAKSHASSRSVTLRHAASHPVASNCSALHANVARHTEAEAEAEADADADAAADSVGGNSQTPLSSASVLPPAPVYTHNRECESGEIEGETTTGGSSGSEEEQPLSSPSVLSETLVAPGDAPGNILAAFDQFWATYPAREGRKVRRQIALQLYVGLGLTAELCAKIQRGAEAVERSLDAARDGGKYLRTADRWLMESGWEDDVAAVSSPPRRHNGPCFAGGTDPRTPTGECLDCIGLIPS